MHSLSYSSPPPCEVGGVMISILQIRILRLRKAKPGPGLMQPMMVFDLSAAQGCRSSQRWMRRQ